MLIYLGYILSILAIIMFYGFIVCAVCVSGAWRYIRKISLKEWGYFGLFIIFSCIFLMFMLNRNDFIYYWDCTMHWTPVIIMSKDLFLDPGLTMRNIYNTTGITDYNWVMPFLYVFPAKILGCEFGKVVMISYGMYTIPALLMNGVCIKAYITQKGYIGVSSVTYAVGIFLFPIVPYVILKGYMDGPVLLLSSVVLLLFLEYTYDKIDWIRNILIAVGMIALVIFRRHWAYWCIGLAFFVIVNFCVEGLSKRRIKYFIINMLSIILVVIATLGILFREFTIRCLRNYSVIYQGWNETWQVKFLKIEESIGNYVLLIIILGIICLCCKNRIDVIKKTIGVWGLLIIPVVIMSSVVLMHESHFYFVVLPIGILLAFFLEEFNEKKVFVYIYIFINFLVCFINPNNTTIESSGKYRYVICDLRYVPYYRSDTQQIRDLVGYLNQESESNDYKVYICASSQNLNWQMMNYAYAPESLDSLVNDLDIASSDLRDGFNTNFFDADLIVIEKNLDNDAIFEYYQAKGSKGVRGFLTDEIQSNKSSIGKHYMLIGEYPLNYQYKSVAQVYKKISEYDISDYEYMIDYYDELYPDYKEKFSDRIYEYVRGKGIE